jgi:hypothetical protein
MRLSKRPSKRGWRGRTLTLRTRRKQPEFHGHAEKRSSRYLIQKYVDPFHITKGKGFRLTDFDPGDTSGLQLDKGEAAELLQRGTAWLAEEQDMLRPGPLVLAAGLPGDGQR